MLSFDEVLEILGETFEDVEEQEMDGVIVGLCQVCKGEIRMEPDAEDSYCEVCEKVQPVYNPVMMLLAAF